MKDDVILSVTIDESEDPVVIVSIEIPEGYLEVMAEIEIDYERRVIIARGLHLHGVDFDANGLGSIRLRQIARAMLEDLDYDECRIEGAIRTTGANPGRRPKPVRFTRKPSPSS